MCHSVGDNFGRVVEGTRCVDQSRRGSLTSQTWGAERWWLHYYLGWSLRRSDCERSNPAVPRCTSDQTSTLVSDANLLNNEWGEWSERKRKKTSDKSSNLLPLWLSVTSERWQIETDKCCRNLIVFEASEYNEMIKRAIIIIKWFDRTARWENWLYPSKRPFHIVSCDTKDLPPVHEIEPNRYPFLRVTGLTREGHFSHPIRSTNSTVSHQEEKTNSWWQVYRDHLLGILSRISRSSATSHLA